MSVPGKAGNTSSLVSFPPKETPLPPILTSNMSGVLASLQKILPPMSSTRNVGFDPTNSSSSFVTLPLRFQHMISPTSLSSLTSLPIPSLLSSSTSTLTKVNANGKSPGLALCLSKSNAQHLFLCLLQQQQQQQLQQNSYVPTKNPNSLERSQVVLETIMTHDQSLNQNQPQLQIAKTTSPALSATGIRLVPATRLMMSGQEKVELNKVSQKSIQRTMPIRSLPDNVPVTLLQSSDTKAPMSESNPSTKFSPSHRALIRSDVSLEELRVSNKKPAAHKSMKQTNISQCFSSFDISDLDLKDAESSSMTAVGFHSKSGSADSMRSNSQKPRTARLTNKAKKTPMLSSDQNSEALKGPKGSHGRSRTVKLNARQLPTSNVRSEPEMDSSTFPDLESSCDESDLPVLHKIWCMWNGSGTFEYGDPSPSRLPSSKIREAKYQRLVDREMRRLHYVRKKLQVQKESFEQEGSLLEGEKRCTGTTEVKERNQRGRKSNVLRRALKTLRATRPRGNVRSCLHIEEGDVPCSDPALPYTNHCIRHIMYNVDQQLYTYCTAKGLNNAQCCTSVLNSRSDPPLCHKHFRLYAAQNGCVSMAHRESLPKRLRKRDVSARRGKKRKVNEHLKRGSTPESRPRELVLGPDPSDESKHAPLCGLSVTLEQNRSLSPPDDLGPSPFEFPAEEEAVHNFCKEDLDEVLPGDFLEDFDLHIDASSCFMDVPDIQDVFGKFPVEVFDFGSSSLRQF